MRARDREQYVEWFRQAAPYIHSHRGKTFVVGFSGEGVADASFERLVHDLALLHSLGVRLVLVHGARPQIEERLREDGAEMNYVNGWRVTDQRAIACVKEAVGAVRVEIEARLSMGLARTPMSGARIRVASGNFVIARPLGVRDGTDYGHTGLVRRVDSEGIKQRLESGAIVLLSPLGYSITGEAFNLMSDDVASATAVALGADKLILLVEGVGIVDRSKRLRRQLTASEAEELLLKHRKQKFLDMEAERHLEAAVSACMGGVRRTHILRREYDGGLLIELFTRDGAGTLVTNETFEGVRPATHDDVGAILGVLGPLEEEGVLVRRSRELLENDIGKFTVIERDRLVVGCAALYPWPHERVAELACVAINPEFREQGRGEQLLEYIENRARMQGIRKIFVLTTQTAHWFLERGFVPGRIADLPLERQQLYNAKRGSKVFLKTL